MQSSVLTIEAYTQMDSCPLILGYAIIVIGFHSKVLRWSYFNECYNFIGVSFIITVIIIIIWGWGWLRSIGNSNQVKILRKKKITIQ